MGHSAIHPRQALYPGIKAKAMKNSTLTPSLQLGERRYLVTDCGHLADWRGVAELAGLAEDQIRYYLEESLGLY